MGRRKEREEEKNFVLVLGVSSSEDCFLQFVRMLGWVGLGKLSCRSAIPQGTESLGKERLETDHSLV